MIARRDAHACQRPDRAAGEDFSPSDANRHLIPDRSADRESGEDCQEEEVAPYDGAGGEIYSFQGLRGLGS